MGEQATELGSASGLAWLRREAGEGGERKDHQRSGHKDDCASQRSHLFTTNSLLGGSGGGGAGMAAGGRREDGLK